MHGINTRRLLATLPFMLALIAVLPARADINLEFRPASQTVFVGDTVDLGLFALSDDATDQSLSAAQVIINWDPNFLQLLDLDTTGAVPLQASFFPDPDPFGLNEVVPPQDGDGIYLALAELGMPVLATPAGVLLVTFEFDALRETASVLQTEGTVVDIATTGGDGGSTIVFDGDNPNTDVTGTLGGAVVTIIPEPATLMLVGLGAAALARGRWRPSPSPARASPTST